MKAVSSVSVAWVGVFIGAGCGSPGGGTSGVTPNCALYPNAPACADATQGGDASGTTSSSNDATSAPDGAQCTADCSGKTCGPDGCGGFCGSCGAGMTCMAGACVAGECGQGGVIASGELKVGQGIAFDKATIAVEHKMDIDAFEDGCLTSLTVDLGKGFGCTLHIEAGGAVAPDGGLRVTRLAFAADSQCPGFPDESEGDYQDTSAMRVMTVVPDLAKVPDQNAPASCLTTNFTVHLEGTLIDTSGKRLNVAPTTLRVSGEVSSVGSTTASCPCAASCGGKECGPDGCGFTCGACGDNELCEPSSGQCLCTPECDGKACGDDGCGGSCGECGAHEACGDGRCIACEPQCSGKTCGDDGCGGSCGSCDANETCGGNGQCGCPTTSCGGACCDAGDKCFQSECCTPRCSGKECGSDGCGGTCGTCGSGETCGSGGQCTCTPDCSGKECGDNGCGGSCGSCGSGETCNAAGQCTSGNAQCSGEGFDVKRESATDNGSSINWVGLNTPSGAFDALTVDFYQVQGASGPEYPVESQAAYNIPGGNYQTCVLCVLLMKGCTAAGSCANATYYFATSGILTLVEFTPGVGGQLEGVITNAVLEEVTIDAQGVSTIVPGGKKWCMENQVFLGPSTLVAP